ncbi:hypothetical protein [Lysobacter gummosus]|uniref:hypothetical protein n=1 Tax=Lysobacter gummosus TaxID=262324 RepID=UPI003639995D
MTIARPPGDRASRRTACTEYVHNKESRRCSWRPNASSTSNTGTTACSAFAPPAIRASASTAATS